MPTSIDRKAVGDILRRYDILPPANGSKRRHDPGGQRADIGGYVRADGQKMLALTVGNISESRPCPFHDGESENMVRRFFTRDGFPRHPPFEEMLERLVSRAARMYSKEPLDAFMLEGIELEGDHYRIRDAHMVHS